MTSPATAQRARSSEEAAISLYAKVVGLSADHIEEYLPDFRDAYAERMRAIPEANHRPADFRIGCEVLRHVSFAVEEPELQKRLACLLAAASDAATQHHVHPAFPGILTALAPEELRLLASMRGVFDPLQTSAQDLERARAYLAVADVDAVHVALDNLARLGLVHRAVSPGQPERLRVSALGDRFLLACVYCD